MKAIAVALTLAAAVLSAQAREVKILSAVGMRQVMLALGPDFERASGHQLAISFDASGLIAARIASGEAFDVAIINRSPLETLAKDGKVSATSLSHIARAVAAVAVRTGAPKPDISSREAFRTLLLSAKSVARPPPSVGGSSGDHIVDVLARLGISAEIDAKSVFVMTGDSRIAASPGDAVAQGKADIALHQLQELMAVPGIEVVGPFPGDLQGTFTFSTAIGARAANVAGARALIAFLRAPHAQAMMRAKGMEPWAP